jgi:shikimate dehydrogenase
LTALAVEHTAKVFIANRNIAKAKNVAEHAKKMGLSCELVSLDDGVRLATKADLIINATPMGMAGEPSMIKHEHIRADSIVYDLVYRPMKTDLIQNAEEAGATVVYGYEMLVEQGAKAFEIWKKMEAPREVMKKTLIGEFV